MKSWRKADEKLMESWWRADEEMMKSWWRADEELVKSWWKIYEETIKSWPIPISKSGRSDGVGEKNNRNRTFGSKVSVFGHFHHAKPRQTYPNLLVKSFWWRNDRNRMFGSKVIVFGHFHFHTFTFKPSPHTFSYILSLLRFHLNT